MHTLPLRQKKDASPDRLNHAPHSPMHTLIGLIHGFLQTRLDAEQRGQVCGMLRAAHTLWGTLMEIPAFSTDEPDTPSLDRLPFHLRDILSALPAMLAPRIGRRPLRVRCRAAEDIPPVLYGDPSRLTKMLFHLADEALAFTEAGEVSVIAEPAGHTADDAVLRFTIRNTGIGTDAGQLATLFEPCARADNSIACRFGGPGSAFSRRLARLMGGDIRVESVPGRGSAFTVEVRLGLKASGAPTAPASGARVLLVEDNEINQEIALELLTGMGIRVDVAADGQEALEAVETVAYDLVFMDVQMPVMDGLEATRRLRAAGHVMPVIAMTAHAAPSDREISLVAGMNDHLTKPLSPDRLRRMLTDWLPGAETSGPRPAALEIPSPVEAAVPLVSAKPASHEAGLLPSELPGINIEAGLAAVGGNGQLYAHLLDKFAARYATAREDITAALRQGDAKTAVRLAHTIKGVAANLGASSLTEAAGLLEKHLLRDLMGAEPYIHTLGNCLAEAVAAARLLSGAFPPATDAAPSGSPGGSAGSEHQPGAATHRPERPGDRAALAAQVREILACMETDWNRASEQARQLRDSLRGLDIEEHGQLFAQAVDDFDMENVTAEGETLVRALEHSR